MKRFFSVLRTILLWAWFIVFSFLFVMILILRCMHDEDVGLFVLLEISWIAVLIVVGVVCETAAEKIREIFLIWKIRGYKRTKLILENEEFGRMIFWHYLKSGTLQLSKPKLSGFGEDEIELIVCQYYGKDCEEKILCMLKQLYGQEEKIKTGLYRCVLNLFAFQKANGYYPFDEKYVEERLHIVKIVINLDDTGTLSAEVYVDMTSKIFDPICTERLNVRAELDYDTEEIGYYF